MRGRGPGVNLEEAYGQRYVVVDDGTNDSSRAERPWCMEIRGKYGAIYPYGYDGRLAVRVDAKNLWKRFDAMELPVVQHGQIEKVYLFHAGSLDVIATMIQAKRRRQISPEMRAKLAERLKPDARTDSDQFSAPEERRILAQHARLTPKTEQGTFGPLSGPVSPVFPYQSTTVSGQEI